MTSSRLRRREVLVAVSAGYVTLSGCVGSDSSRDKDSAIWNVETHGIEGDGTTDVGENVQDVLNQVNEAGGGVVYFPPGRYLFEQTPLIGDDTILRGAGRSTVFEGSRPDDFEGGALLSNKGYAEQGYAGASNWGVQNIRIDSPDSNGIMPAHAENVRLENIYGDTIYYHHIDVVSSKNVIIDGYWASKGGEGGSDAPIQFDAQQTGISSNGIWDGTAITLVEDDDTPTKQCRLRNFEIDPVNTLGYGVHIHRGPHESITIRDGYITGCQYTAIRSDPDEQLMDVTIDGVSCIDNARGITLGHIESGRRGLTISNVNIRTDDNALASGSGLYTAGFDGASISNVSVDGNFTNSIIVDDMIDLKMSNITAKGAHDQAFRFRENVDVTLSTSRAADCGGAGIYSGPGSFVTYGGITFEDVGSEVVVDGKIREWESSSDKS